MKTTKNMTAKQIAAEGLRRWLLEYADAATGDAECLDFLAEVSEAIDAASGMAPSWPA